MENAISISEVIGTIEEGKIEICASADAAYDRAKQRVFVSLEAFARRVSAFGDGSHIPMAWLPAREHVTNDLPREDAVAFAKDVFRSWARKVHGVVPAEAHLMA
jgi:hypothetical protein